MLLEVILKLYDAGIPKIVAFSQDECMANWSAANISFTEKYRSDDLLPCIMPHPVTRQPIFHIPDYDHQIKNEVNVTMSDTHEPKWPLLIRMTANLQGVSEAEAYQLAKDFFIHSSDVQSLVLDGGRDLSTSLYQQAAVEGHAAASVSSPSSQLLASTTFPVELGFGSVWSSTSADAAASTVNNLQAMAPMPSLPLDNTQKKKAKKAISIAAGFLTKANKALESANDKLSDFVRLHADAKATADRDASGKLSPRNIIEYISRSSALVLPEVIKTPVEECLKGVTTLPFMRHNFGMYYSTLRAKLERAFPHLTLPPNEGNRCCSLVLGKAMGRDPTTLASELRYNAKNLLSSKSDVSL